jgi:hypothetical protein
VNCSGTGTACGSGATAIGQSYWVASGYCLALGMPGSDPSYDLPMALAAAAAAPQPDASQCSNPPCTGVGTCTTTATNQDMVYVDLTDTGGPCYVWSFKTTGSGSKQSPSGHVYMDATRCGCPYASDPTWN